MRSSALADLGSLARGVGFLWRHPWQTLGLTCLTGVLALLGPVLQIGVHLPEDPMISLILALVAMIPLELYFMPRWILALDAETLDHPQNPRASWKATFETRWLAACAAKALLYLLVGLGATCLLFPGLLILTVFGWAPWRVLLRGETLKAAAKGSAACMARCWPRVLLVFSAILGVYLAVLTGAMVFHAHFAPDPVTPWTRLTNPAVWTIDLGGGLLNLWLSATCLALFHRLEEPVPAPAPSTEDR